MEWQARGIPNPLSRARLCFSAFASWKGNKAFAARHPNEVGASSNDVVKFGHILTRLHRAYGLELGQTILNVFCREGHRQ